MGPPSVHLCLVALAAIGRSAFRSAAAKRDPASADCMKLWRENGIRSPHGRGVSEARSSFNPIESVSAMTLAYVRVTAASPVVEMVSGVS